MKIGILTFHRAKNYGAFMQAYSMQQALSKYFPQHQVEIINYNTLTREYADRRRFITFVHRRGLIEAIKMLRQYSKFYQSLRKLKCSKLIITNNEKWAVKQIDSQYDVVIIGSDAVFNWWDLGLPNVYYLCENKHCKKLSYAASAHEQKYYNMTKEQKKYLREALGGFSYIGVRDKSTEQFVKYVLGRDVAVHNCDPTVLLEVNTYETPRVSKLIKKVNPHNKPIMLLMLKKKEIGKWIYQLYHDKYLLIAITDGNSYADSFLYDLTPFEWSKIFSFASITITDYFHGTLVSLRNGTPTLSIDTSGYTSDVYEGKIKDLLLTRLHIEECFVEETTLQELEEAEKIEFLKKRINTILNQDLSQRIKEGLDHEEKSFFDFIVQLETLLKSMGESNE